MTDHACVICQRHPRDPRIGLACQPCADRLAGHLAAIPALWLDVANRDDALRATQGGQKVRGTHEHASPVNLAAVDATAAARAGSVAVRDRSPWPQDQIGDLAVATTLDDWARDIAASLGHRLPDPDVATLCRWLGDRLTWVLREHPAVDEFAADVAGLWGALRRLAGLTEPRPELLPTPCRGCDLRTLYREAGEDRIICGECGLRYTPDEDLHQDATADGVERFRAIGSALRRVADDLGRIAATLQS
jgi:hypothetical protein